MSLLVIDPVLAFSPHKKMFFFAGLNFSAPFRQGNWGTSTEMTGAYGAQGGLAIKPAPQFGIEAMYRTLNFETSMFNRKAEYSRLWGIAVRATYTL